jgi:hypothetical protein
MCENCKRYRVRYRRNREYEVVRVFTEKDVREMEKENIGHLEKSWNGDEYLESQFQGSLADCEAWIRLNEGGYM